MPLRAIVHGTEVIAPLLNQREWIDLQSHIKRDGWEVIMPCCETHGFARTSKLGTAHFVHQHQPQHCTNEPETWEHLRTKTEIVKACIASGWNASTEVAGNGWRADVLCTKGNTKIAFEVQWSSQTWEETKYRQERYAADGVRGYWLFKRTPSGAELTKDIPFSEFRTHESKETTVLFKDGKGNSDTIALSTMIKDLLAGKFQFREFISLPLQEIYLCCCWSCKAFFVWAYPSTSNCGYTYRGFPHGNINFRTTYCGIVPFILSTSNKHANCPKCAQTNTHFTTIDTIFDKTVPQKLYLPHWCSSQNGKRCDE